MNRFGRLYHRRGLPAAWLSALLLVARLANASSWVPVGPGAAYHDSLRSLTVQPGSPGKIWLGMSHGGLYRSQNRGSSWTWVGAPFGSTPPYGRSGIAAIDADRSLPGRLFAATSVGVYRTDDGGTHWTQVSGPGFARLLGESEPERLAATPGALYVSAGPRLLVSPDGGRTFEVRFEGTAGSISFAADPFRAGRIYLTHAVDGVSHLKKSTNAGMSWSEVETLTATGPGSISRLAAAGGVAYVAWYGEDPALWGSRDGGATWRRLLDGDVDLLLIHPTKARTLYAIRSRSGGPSALWVSRDGGDSWRILGPLYLQRLAIDPSSDTLFGYEGYALVRSSDGKTWETLFIPPYLEWAEVARLSFRPDRPKHQALTVGGRLYRSFDGGASWSWRDAQINFGDVALDGDDPNRLIAVTTGSSAGTLLSEDGGRTWRGTSEIENGEGLIRSDRNTLFAIGCGISRTTDNGASWQKVLRCHPTDDEEDLTKRWTAKLDVDPLRPDRVYALSFNAELDSLPHGPLNGWPSFLWRSEDGGTTWRRISSNLGAFALERGTGRLYILRGGKLLASDDAGRTWRTLGASPGGLDLIADPTTSGALYAINYTALKWSPDRGTTWQTIGPGGGWVLQFDPAHPKVIYTGTNYGVFRLTLP